MEIILLNFLYATMGSLLAILGMALGFRLLDWLLGLDIRELLLKGNRAVGVVVAGMFIGIGLAVGLVIGLALN